ncbi:MAG: helix-turn-helix transcriptional regulator [Candidatus Marinimicrobia bacterium]|nr:helix-turn-helix transcriptional regulator [Candidatus Neomarinimicrobiota bacterium]
MKKNISYEKLIHLKLGNRIREFRKQRNLSIEKLAFKADLHPTFLGLVERGETNASVTTLIKIANALDKDIVDLFSFLCIDQIEIYNTEKEELIHELISELIKYDPAKIKLSIEIIKLCMKF